MNDEEFEKYFTLLLKCFIEYDYGQRLTAYPKVRKILEEIWKDGYDVCIRDISNIYTGMDFEHLFKKLKEGEPR